MKISNDFIGKLSQYGDRVAINDTVNEYTYADLVENIYKFKQNLDKLNVVRGETVFIIDDYSFDSIALFFSLAINENIIVPITSTNEQEVNERIDVVQPEWIFSHSSGNEKKNYYKHRQEKHPFIKTLVESKTPGLILFSSGSTGKPKAMVHNLEGLLSSYIDKRGKEINFLLFLMFDHIGGLNTLFNCLSMGVYITIPKNRNPNDIAKLIEKNKINILPSSPTFLNLMCISNVFDSYDLSSIRMITYGTEAMPESLLLKLKEKLPKVKFLQTFGTSETGIMNTSSLSSSSTLLKFEDINQEYKIVNDELWLRSKTQILGYINHSNESFTKDGWFMTGDLVEQTADGYIKIIGRLKEQINVGGEKVLPAEVESVIMELDSIEDCIVKSERNAITGQMVVVDVVLKDGYNFKNEKSKIKSHCRIKLEPYKIPARINVIDKVLFTNRFKKVRNTK